MRQEIFYVPPPDPQEPSSSDQILDALSHVSLVGSELPWPQQILPEVVVQVVVFGQIPVEVTCEVSNTYRIMQYD